MGKIENIHQLHLVWNPTPHSKKFIFYTHILLIWHPPPPHFPTIETKRGRVVFLKEIL